MSTPSELAKRHFDALTAETDALKLDVDAVGRAMIDQVLKAAVERRGLEDVQSELQFLIENLDPDTDHMFMRP